LYWLAVETDRGLGQAEPHGGTTRRWANLLRFERSPNVLVYFKDR
jgi:hypothetical protein